MLRLPFCLPLSRLEGRAVIGQHRGINRIGLGPLALGTGEVTDPARFDDADGDVCRVQRPHDRLLVAAGGFADDLHMRMGAQEFEELGVTFGVIGQGMKTARQMQLQSQLGNVEADMEDGVVQTHTCEMRATMICGRRAQATVRVRDAKARVDQAGLRIRKIRRRCDHTRAAAPTPGWLSPDKKDAKRHTSPCLRSLKCRDTGGVACDSAPKPVYLDQH